MGPWKLLKMARVALRQWKALPDRQRERVRGDAERVGRLSIELVRLTRLRTSKKDEEIAEFESVVHDAPPGPTTATHRAIATVSRELRTALLTLGVSAGTNAHGIARANSRTVRYGSKLVERQIRRLSARDGKDDS